MQITWNFAQFDRELKRIAIAQPRKTLAELVKQETKLFVRDAAKFTPPTGKAPVRESWAEQKRAGMQAVERDVRKAFIDAASLKAEKPKFQRSIDKYVASKDLGKLGHILKRMKINGPIVQQPSTHLHNQRRDSRGRVRGSRNRAFVLQVGAIDKFIKIKQALVGYAKSGWARAANTLGAVLPNWVTRHAGSGVIQMKLTGPQPSITVGDTVAYVQSEGADMRVIQKALDRRAQAMKSRTEAMLKKQTGWQRSFLR